MAKFSFSRRDREFGDLFKPRGKAPVQGLYQKPDLFPARQSPELIAPGEDSPDYSVSDVRSPKGEHVISTFRDMGLLSDLYNIATSLGNTRKERYREYDLMEESVLIASFLEMLSDDAFQRDAEREASVWVKDCEYHQDIEKFLRDINVEEVGWGWMYTFIKYGDMFVKPETESGKGVQWVRDDVHPSDVWRIELNGKLVGFAMAESTYTGYSAPYTGGESSIGRVMDRDSMVHFMFNYRPLYERVKISIPKSLFKDDAMIQSLKENRVKSLITEKEYDATGQLVGENEKTYTFSVSAKYGSSALFNVRKDYKILNLEEQALALGRLARSAVARVFYVNTTGANPKQRAEIMGEIASKFSKRKGFNKAEDLFKSEYSPLNYLDDIFLPITGDIGDVRVEQIGGDLNIKDIVDIDFFLNKVFAGLRTPKSFLGFEESLPGSLGNTTLVRLDIRYARMVKKLQRAFLEGLKELIRIHIKFKFGVPLEDDEIPLQMVTISGAEESDRINTLKEKIDAANAVLGFVSSAQGNTRAVATVLYDRFLALNFTDADGNILEGKDVFAKDFTAEASDQYSPPDYTPSLDMPSGGPVPGEGPSEAPELSTSMTTGPEMAPPEPAGGEIGEEG